MPGPVQVSVGIDGVTGAVFAAQSQQASPSLFVFNGGPYVTAVHADSKLIGPTSLYPGLTLPRQAGRADRTLRQRVWTSVSACGHRIGIASGKSPDTSVSQGRWSGRDGTICWFDFARIVSV